MRITNRSGVIALMLMLALTLTACGGDDSTDGTSEGQASAGALPDELDCASFASVDLRPLLTAVTNTVENPSSCRWDGALAGGSADDDPLTDKVTFTLEDGLPDSYSAQLEALGSPDESESLVSELTADGWTYGLIIGEALNSFNGGSSGIAYYFVGENGRGASCVFDPFVPEDVRYGDDAGQVAYLEERAVEVEAACSQLLATARS